MLHRVCVSALGLLSLAAGSVSASTIDSITSWTGSGTNRAALIVDWNDGQSPASLAFGYRWDGAAPSTAQMFIDIVHADPRLFAKVSTAGQFGTSVFGVGYDANLSNGFGITGAGTFDSGGLAIVPSSQADGGVPSFAGDRYVEGWLHDGFWAEYESSFDPFSSGGTWGDGFGLGTAPVSNGEFIGLSFAPVYVSSLPDNPVPEPIAASLVLAAGLVSRRRRVEGRIA